MGWEVAGVGHGVGVAGVAEHSKQKKSKTKKTLRHHE